MELAPIARQRFFDNNGLPLAGGKLYTYTAGTTTPVTSYSDRSGTANTNPVILDANGYCDIWLDSGYYKFVLKDSLDNTLWTKDQVSLADTASLASAFWRDVVYVTSADSPLTLTQSHNGKLLSIDATSGAISVILPQISLTVLPYNIGMKLTNATNAVTISRTGTDTIEGATTKTMNTTNASCQLIADIDKSPDQWAQLDFGIVDFSGYPTATPDTTDFAMIVDTSAGSINKKASFKAFKNAVYRSVTTTDSVTVEDETMVLSGASFTSTLPTAVGVAGKRYKYLHGGTSLSQVYTLNTLLASGQTIGGVASGSYALYTNGEVLEIESDGANWIIVNHYTSSAWTSYTPTLVGFGTTTSQDFNWWRSGPNINIHGVFTSGTTTGVEAQIPFPTGVTSTAFASIRQFGNFTYQGTGASYSNILVEPSKTYMTVGFQAAGGQGLLKTVGNTYSPSTKHGVWALSIPVVGFQP